MVYTCFLCKWRSDRQPRRSFHKFPSNIELKQKWLQICGKSNVSVGERTSLCNIHFEEDCFRYGLVMGRKILKDGSVPTLHLTKGGKIETSMQSVDVIKPAESQINNSLTHTQPKDDLVTKDVTSETNVGQIWKDSSSQLATGNILVEIPVEFCPLKELSRKRINSESLEKQNQTPSQRQKDIECRLCLQKFDSKAGLLDIFQPWKTPWDGMGETIAQDLSQIANVDIKSTDSLSRLICQLCHQKLLEACSFVASVRINDKVLWRRAQAINKQESIRTETQDIHSIKTETFHATLEVEVKQEELSDDESYDNNANETFKSNVEVTECNKFCNWEIKVECDETNQPQNYSSINGANIQNECVQNSMLLHGDHKRPKIEPETGQLRLHGDKNLRVCHSYAGNIGVSDVRVRSILPEEWLHQPSQSLQRQRRQGPVPELNHQAT